MLSSNILSRGERASKQPAQFVFDLEEEEETGTDKKGVQTVTGN